MKLVHVAVGVILREQQVFITLRDASLHQGGKWEFPGGKVEAGETVTQALIRELQEEVDIQVKASQPFMLIEHDYGDKQVKLDIHLVSDFNGEPHGREGQQGKWVELKMLSDYRFPDANKAIVEKLQGESFSNF
ncbi:8-oxo-dGTP diphosphatase MutT [Bowmanella pacifica]|uniref:8-oxo-dGTP diphosphatase n=1 Tax=Bowmanella pacifica TaxID=502051 RepID=A0A918DJQ4_9ALTE|nr:8-oxo-dGTP diphosphatase MutT [Bowmanella pacifica]GGO68825.1 7,8-dihydro-8-oxoguanine-triphosphatase [Bowmanella pacifica]